MTRFITPIILIGISIGVFFVFMQPEYNQISTIKTQIDSYDQALNNSKALEAQRDSLTLKYNAINPLDIEKLKKLLPDSIDNIRLILEIEGIASNHKMVLKNIQYNSASPITNVSTKSTITASPVQGAQIPSTIAINASSSTFGTWELSFSTTSSYADFLSFTNDLQNNLRIVDISSITFSSGSNSSGGGSSLAPTSDMYTYNFKIKTYWLKN